MLWIVPSLLLLAVGFFFVSNSHAATPTAAYKTLKTDGDFELRAYETLHLAKVTLSTSDKRSKNMDGSFMKLFRFIDGQNQREEKISMTTPVIIERGANESSMSFVMPETSVAKGLPTPNGEVKLAKMPPVKMAVLRFSGISNRKKEAEQLTRLQTWMANEKLSPEMTPLFAFYDPPWTLGFMRRNEVLLRVKEK
jgi:hypothetical protein